MSIKGIDAQIMVTRTAELARDTSSQLHKNELMQDYLSVQSKLLEAKESQTVIRLSESEQMRLHADEEGDSGGASGQEAQGRQADGLPEEDEEIGETLEEHILDIIV